MHVAIATTSEQVAAASIQINPCWYGKHDEMLRHLCNMVVYLSVRHI